VCLNMKKIREQGWVLEYCVRFSYIENVLKVSKHVVIKWNPRTQS